jgi:hypothetical protein
MVITGSDFCELHHGRSPQWLENVGFYQYSLESSALGGGALLATLPIG